jgi:hypothetical protein
MLNGPLTEFGAVPVVRYLTTLNMRRISQLSRRNADHIQKAGNSDGVYEHSAG